MESFNSISAPADIGSFVSGQNVSVKVYPPPKAEYKPPELPPSKQPDAPPINLVSDSLQVQLCHDSSYWVDLTELSRVVDTLYLCFDMLLELLNVAMHAASSTE